MRRGLFFGCSFINHCKFLQNNHRDISEHSEEIQFAFFCQHKTHVLQDSLSFHSAAVPRGPPLPRGLRLKPYSMIVFVCNISWRCNSKSLQHNWILEKVPERSWNYIFEYATSRIFLQKFNLPYASGTIKQALCNRQFYHVIFG